MSINHRDYIWECDYGQREPVFSKLRTLLEEQNEFELGTCAIFANNNPYMLELFVVLGYENPSEDQVDKMMKLMSETGAKRRTDITLNRLIKLQLQRRFNGGVVSTYKQLREVVDSQKVILYPERQFFQKIYNTEPLGSVNPVFLSHATPDKPIVEDIIPYLTRAGTSIWYDTFSIDYGQSLIKAIQSGIKRSRAVVFYISKNFLKSNWCDTEMESFLSRYINDKSLLIISLICPEVEHEDLPLFIQNLKYYRLKEESTAASIAKEINPTLRKQFDL